MSTSRKKKQVILFAIIAIFIAAFAGGGCNGSSSSRSSGVPAQLIGGERLEGDFGKMLADRLGEDFGHETYVVGMGGPELTKEQIDRLRESYDRGAAIVLHGANEAQIGEMRLHFGIDSGESESGAASVSAAADDDGNGPARPELVIFRKIGRDVFEGAMILINENNGATTAISVDTTPLSKDHDFPQNGSTEQKQGLSKEQIEELSAKRPLSAHHEAMIDSLIGWNARADEHAKKIDARRAAATAKLNAASDSDVLTDLASAYIKQIEWNFGDIDGGFKFPTIYQTITIYSCYSYDKDEDWHLIETSSSMNPQDNYKHWTESGLGGCDWVQNYTRRFKTWAVHQIGDKSKIWLQKHLPQNMNNGYTNTDSFSWNVGGSIGFNGSSPTGALTGGVTVGNSTAYTVHDYDAQDQTDDKTPSVTYEFDLPADGDHHFDYQELKDASDISRYNFTSQESWIWNLDHGSAKADRYKFNQHVQYWSGKSRGNQCAFGVSLGNRWDGTATWQGAYSRVTIPTPPTLGTSTTQLLANAKGRTTGDDQPVKFDVLSGGDWSATCDADWVTLTPASGKATGNTPISVLVEISENTGATRTATITVKGTRKQVGTIAISQEGAK